jgi:cystathionine beta-synthase
MAFIIRQAGRAISQKPCVAAHGRCFGAAVDPVTATARAMKETPYNPEKEGEIAIPNYDGWNSKVQSEFEALKTASQRSEPKKSDLPYKGICDSVVDLVGRTPMIRMSRLAKHLDVECEMVAKAEFLSAGGSTKDRVAKCMIEEAERSGRIKPGDTLIEPTSGNTGIGLCIMAAQKGYKMIICMPQKMSLEKLNAMKCLGGEVLRTPSAAKWNTPESHVGLAARIAKQVDGHILDQYMNAANPLSHYEGTAEEIVQQCDGKLDYMVMGTGTGGTLTGTALKLKEKIPGVKIVAVDPYGSTMAEPAEINEKSARTGHKKFQSYQIEGIGHDYMPTVLNHDVVDYWVKTDEDESFAMARNIIHHEGLLVGAPVVP